MCTCTYQTDQNRPSNVHIPNRPDQTSEQTIDIYLLTIHARTNVPLSSARIPTSFQQPLEIESTIWFEKRATTSFFPKLFFQEITRWRFQFIPNKLLFCQPLKLEKQMFFK